MQSLKGADLALLDPGNASACDGHAPPIQGSYQPDQTPPANVPFSTPAGSAHGPSRGNGETGNFIRG